MDEKKIDAQLNELKDRGILSALVREDGVLLSSTIPFHEGSAVSFANVNSIIDAMMKIMKDLKKETEISFGSDYLVMLPLGHYILCGIVKDREQKKIMREQIEKLKPNL